MLNHPETGGVQRVLRRRRTREHRRNRATRRILLIVFCVGLAIGFSSLALQYLSPSVFRGARTVERERLAAEVNRNLLQQVEQESLQRPEKRPVYPYSIVPGGVKDGHELKWAAAHDPVVAAHFAGFDYDHARVVRLLLARSAYVSYRMGNRVYWTRRRLLLKKGETVITDGKIMARTRCANRVEEVPPPQATTNLEPPAPLFEEPIHPGGGTAVEGPPPQFQSMLVNRPQAPGLGPAPPLSMVDPFTGGSWVPLTPPPLPSVCGVGKNKNGSGSSGSNGKGKGNPCGNGGGGGEVPEPGTWLLVGTGLAAIYWKTRRRFA